MSINKSQGATVGAILLAGLLLHPLGSNAPQMAVSSNALQGAQTTPKATEPESDGPWIASCKYWAPARDSEDDKASDSDDGSQKTGTKPTKGHTTEANETQYQVNLRAGEQIDVYQHPTKESEELGCKNESNRWGIPTKRTGLHVTAIIATVPDPVHTHLALSFDRYVDALLQAAADNNYVSSYHWLPWKNRLGAPRNTDSSLDAEPGHDPERERQPGLIILKHVPTDTDWDALGSQSYSQVIYVFLVGETPTLGVDGFQLRNAFDYENELQQKIESTDAGKDSANPKCDTAKPATCNTFSRGKDNDIAIIGPYYSGSAVSLKAGIEEAVKKLPNMQSSVFDISGATSSKLAVYTLMGKGAEDKAQIHYLSFQINSPYVQQTFLNSLGSAGYDLNRVAFLFEDDTASGNTSAYRYNTNADQKKSASASIHTPLIIRFPRDISLLRNAKGAAGEGGGESASPGSAPSPYLHFSLTDSSIADSIPRFSRDTTPLSQEAQLMAIARQLQRDRIQFVVVSASNPLDTIFLAQFFHRARPDARLVFTGADQLMERELDNVPFVGAINITPYSISNLGKSQANSRATRPYPESAIIAYYNAAIYTFWNIHLEKPENTKSQPYLLSYNSIFQPLPVPMDKDHPADKDDTLGDTYHPVKMYPPLWMTTNGTDGYYPLAILNPCASDLPQILPVFNPGIGVDVFKTPSKKEINDAINKCPSLPTEAKNNVRARLKTTTFYPSLLWVVLCVAVSLFCAAHAVFLLIAGSRFSFAHDLAIIGNDQPERRSMAIHVGAAMLSSMAFVVAWPVLSLNFLTSHDWNSILISCFTLLCALAAVLATFLKTCRSIGWVKAQCVAGQVPALPQRVVQRIYDNIYFFICCLAWIALIALPLLWWYLCHRELVGEQYSLVGVSFAFRCLHPASGVSPMVPVLFLLFGWYLWALFLTRRLRFSPDGRPHLPKRFADGDKDRFFVSDEDLEECEHPHDSCLYENITCLFITRNTIHRFLKWPQPVVDGILSLIYTTLLILFSFFTPIQSLSRFLWSHQYLASPYEFLIGVLFFPLMAIALSGWLRIVLVWNSLRSGLLQRLEDQPIRFAFDRLEGLGWMTMLRQADLHQQWRDEARSIESASQLLRLEDLKPALDLYDKKGHAGTYSLADLETKKNKLVKDAEDLRLRLNRHKTPASGEKPDHELVGDLEIKLAEFAKKLLHSLLIPYWSEKRTGLVDSKATDEIPVKARHAQLHTRNPHLPLELHAAPVAADPACVQAAEEFLAIRYLSLIRAVLAHLGSLMSFVSVAFVLAVIAWNIYPFQPREWVNWALTGLMVLLGSGIVRVFAQMHRDPILSRITETNANELGVDFYIRIVTFGAVPVFTWLAYQFPDIGNFIFKFLQPGLGVIK